MKAGAKARPTVEEFLGALPDPDDVGEAAYRAVRSHLEDIIRSETEQYGAVSLALLAADLRVMAGWANNLAHRIEIEARI